MLVVAIIGLLAAIAIPKFANLVIKAKEAAIRGKLGSLRSALSIYYADNEGTYPHPGNISQVFTIGGKYLDAVPSISIPTVPSHADFNFIAGIQGLDWVDGGGISPPWGYDSSNGTITINCTHTDTKGTTWSLW